MAKERGISIIGITDHNSVDRVDVALESGDRLGITVLPGIEVTTHEDTSSSDNPPTEGCCHESHHR